MVDVILDWSNERYVRVYTRDTTAMLMMAWDELALFWALLRKVDRAGVLDLEGHGAGAVAAHLRCPLEVAARAMASWIKAGWIEVQSTERLVIPSHIVAQETLQSDKQRQQESRGRRRDQARNTANSSEPVTKRDDMSHSVTAGHTKSHGVTPSLAVPSLAKPSQSLSSESAKPSSDKWAGDINRIWEAYMSEWTKHIGKGKRPGLKKWAGEIRGRLREGYSAEGLCAIPPKLFASDWHRGSNGKAYLSPFYAFGAKKIDQWTTEQLTPTRRPRLAPWVQQGGQEALDGLAELDAKTNALKAEMDAKKETA